MAKEVYEWRNLIEGDAVETGENSQIRTSIIERSDQGVTGIVAIRKWARYIKKDERDFGVTLDEVEFRPTKDGLSLSIEQLGDLIAELQELDAWYKKNKK